MTRWVISILLLLHVLPNSLLAKQTKKYDLNEDLFPIPSELIPNIDFWISVFSQYSGKQAVLHDTQDLNIIYEVADFSNVSEDTLKSWRLKQRMVDKIKDKYRDILTKLSKIKPADVPKLSPEEKRIYDLFEGQQNSNRFRLAQYNIRAQFGLREEFLQGLIRSGTFIDEMQEIFRENGLPEELTCLPHVESSFNYNAYSKVGAAGMWQFTRKTGRRYVKINYAVDDRLDPIRATEAAAKFLKNNYETLQAWPLAITAYNHGVNGMKRARKIVGTDDFGVILKKYRSRTFKFASRNFYAEFIAAVQVRKNYRHYFGNIALDAPLDAVYFELPKSCNFKKLTELFQVENDVLRKYNPSIRPAAYSGGQQLHKGFSLRLPKEKSLEIADAFAYFMQTKSTPVTLENIENMRPQTVTLSKKQDEKSAARISEKKEMFYLPHVNLSELLLSNTITLSSDENLEDIADWLEITMEQLYQINNLQEDEEIGIGQEIKLDFCNVTPYIFHNRRFEYHQSIEDDFLLYFEITGVRIHQLQPGEDVWTLCDDVYEIPYWLLLKYNENLKLDDLKDGDEIIFPVVVALAEKNSEMMAPGSEGE